MNEKVKSYQYNMYYTDKFNGEIQYDCLRYTVLDNIVDYREKLPLQHQFILYCFRPIEHIEKKIIDMSNNNESIFSKLTFQQLKMKNISTFDLFNWSIPIDVIERYAAYLISDSNVDMNHEEIIYNCTLSWFGSFCQYTFYTNDSFSNVVKTNFDERNWFNMDIRNENTTCYIHLPCVHRSWAPMCLDWREICDGKIDCMNNGIDEENCFDLEKNECEGNEYRCQNGLCILQEFFHDDIFNPECLDRTDEISHSIYPKTCSSDPSFRCEEHMCERTTKFPCGDGSCFGLGEICANDRGNSIKKVRTIFENDNLCWKIMYCLIKLPIGLNNEDYDSWCNNLINILVEDYVRKQCPTLFNFPNDFLLYGHIRFLYSNEDLVFSDSNHLLPTYICYKQEACEFLPPTNFLVTSTNESVTCQHFRDLNSTLSLNNNYEWSSIVVATQKLFHACTNINDDTLNTQEIVSLFHCPNSKKYISKHRLLDGIRDCGGNEDETYNNSCSLNDKYRVKCPDDDKCIAPILMNDYSSDCLDIINDDKQFDREYKKKISFQTLCDGFVELTPLIINGSEETDETNCQHWPCNNTYTRCDGFWNCPNGADEVNCPSIFVCPPLEQICISPITRTVTCLPINEVNNGKVDCLGGTDERLYCRKKYPQMPQRRFLCNSNTEECLLTHHICDGAPSCPLGEDEYFCPTTNLAMCSAFWDGKRNVSEDLLCQLNDEEKPKIIYFSLKNFLNYPLSLNSIQRPSTAFIHYKTLSISPIVSYFVSINWPSTWRCNRGLNIRVYDEYKCLCPPSYYGDLCQYQNQRVSLTIRIRTQAEWRTVFLFLITLIDDTEHIINSYDQFNYIAIRDCDTKFNIYLLYNTQPKDRTRNYSIRIDVFDKNSFTHRATWLYPIRFSFLPVHRISILLNIPWSIISRQNCKLNCHHGRCIDTVNNPNNSVCQCDSEWSGKLCNVKEECNCSPQSLCMGKVNNRSICLCPIDTFGPRCYLTQNICQSQSCYHNGQCIPNNFGQQGKGFICICKEGYSGDRCEHIDSHIDISFHSTIKIPSSILAHFITINLKDHPIRTTLFKKIGFNQNNAILFISIQFRLVFVQFDNKYYLAIHKSTQSHIESISTMIIPSHRCLSINELFNSTILNFHLLHRLKYYHLACKDNIDLICFYDSLHICLCTIDHQANCFEFDHNVTYNCQGQKICTNEAECFQDHPICPTSFFCVCKDCFYGSRCQYSTNGFHLSLDIILGYHIKSNLVFTKQPTIIKISTFLVTIMSITGLISAIFSILTFRTANSQKVGCGKYLLTTSSISVVMVIMFPLKMFLLFVSQMGLITQRSFLLGHCILIDFFLRILLNISDWLDACVAMERAMALVKGPYFDAAKSKVVSKYIIIFVVMMVIITTLHDPFHRQLVDDIEDGNPWCVVAYSDLFAFINSIVLIFHFLTPFLINIISAIVIIIMTTHQKSSAKKQVTRHRRFCIKLRQHKHLLISPCILILLALPRLIMSFYTGCMNSSRDSWFYLAGYFISFIPPVLTFFVFILPSKTYKKEFLLVIKRR